jgi:hypothetical protein
MSVELTTEFLFEGARLFQGTEFMRGAAISQSDPVKAGVGPEAAPRAIPLPSLTRRLPQLRKKRWLVSTSLPLISRPYPRRFAWQLRNR